MIKLKIKNILKKKNKKPIISLTAYSKTISEILDKYCDLILVGDSLANVLYGLKNTHAIDLKTMTNHARSVMLGVKKSTCVVDMPKGTYNTKNQALRNAKYIISKSNCDAVKIENYKNNSLIIKHLVKSGINVMGHIGYTPQFKEKFKPSGLSKLEQDKLLREAIKIQTAGAFSIVLECVETKTSKLITKTLKIPTIGIGSSVNCDGQILVTDDILGLSGFYPKFVKKYTNLKKIIEKVTKEYRSDVIKKKFPRKKNSY
jgi:3-methyl-2-oxobutanoate hydroxymethyltransferase